MTHCVKELFSIPVQSWARCCPPYLPPARETKLKSNKTKKASLNDLGTLKYQLLAFAIILSSCDSSNNISYQNEVVFISDKEIAQTFELYRTNTSGSAIQKLSHGLPLNGDVTDFALSPNGQYIAYRATNGIDTLMELFIAKIDGSSVYKISGSFPQQPPVTAGVDQYVWSPDSKHLAYLATYQDNITQKTMYLSTLSNKSNINITPLTTVGSFRWSPDSANIAYSGRKTNEINSLGIYITDKNGQAEIKVSGDLITNETVFNDGFFWSPNGSHLTYLKRNSSSIDEMYIVQSDGTENNNVSYGVTASLPYWSWAPDSSRLAYIADQDTSDTYELYTITPDATENQKISILQSTNEDVTSFSWAPDSSRIAYTIADAGVPMGLYTVTSEGMHHTKISGSLFSSEQVITNSFYWAPDSCQIAYLSNTGTNNSQLFIVNPDGTNPAHITNSDILNNNVIANPIWSPNSNHIAFNASIQGILRLYTANTDNQNVIQVSQESNVIGGSVIFQGFKWTSDSKYLIYKATFNNIINEELFSSTIDADSQNNISGTMVSGGHVDSFDIQ